MARAAMGDEGGAAPADDDRPRGGETEPVGLPGVGLERPVFRPPAPPYSAEAML